MLLRSAAGLRSLFPIVACAGAVAGALPTEALAKPKPSIVEFRSVPASAKGIATALATEKPGRFREQLVWGLEQKVREKGIEVSDPDTFDALTTVVFQKIFDDMAAATEVWTWSGDDGPRGDVLIRQKLRLLPGRNTTGYVKPITVTPKGKRIDRGYLNMPCTVELSVAKSEAEWHQWIEGKGWGAYVHPALELDGVARVVVSLFSPGKEGAPYPRHERPVWIAYFQRQDDPEAPWAPVLFEPMVAKEQRFQESNLLPGDPRVKLTDAHKRLVLALRMEDVRMINPARTQFLGREVTWFNLGGLTECPVDAKTVGWLDAYRTSDHPLVRAAAVIKSAMLGGKVGPAELIEISQKVKVGSVQVDAFVALSKLVEASAEAISEEDKLALVKLVGTVDDLKLLKDVARVKSGKTVLFYRRGVAGWEALLAPTPKK